jgi:hypothetical protein
MVLVLLVPLMIRSGIEPDRMAKRKVVTRRRSRVPDYRVLGCPLTKSNSLWCHGLCVPKDGIGVCGRIAPHTVQGRTQMAILKYKIKNQEVHRDYGKI